MNIRELNLLAYGPFTDKKLDFSAASGGLHIVYGPNEAGKSSALRGLKGLLYGIPARTSDNFLHDNRNLRIAGTLVDDSGQLLEVVRRKGNVKTLLNTAGEPLDEAVLMRVMQGLSAEVFNSLFGIDHDALVLGGQEILNQKGEVGQALFSASLGSHSLHEVLATLEDDASALFLPGGSKPEINTHIREYADTQKAIRDVSLSSKEWQRQDDELRATTAALNALTGRLGELKAQLARLQRARSALPKFARRGELLQRLETLGDAVILAEDFGKRRQAAIAEREKAITTQSNAAASIQGLEEQLDKLPVKQPLLETRQDIERLHADLGGHSKAMRDRPGLVALRDRLQADATELARSVNPDISLDEAEQLRPVLKKRPRITELGNDRNRVIADRDRALGEQRETEARLTEKRAALESMTQAAPTDALRARVAAARKQGDLDATIQAKEENIAATERRLADFLSNLSPVWVGSLGDFDSALFPGRQSIEKYVTAYGELGNREALAREREAETQRRLADAQSQLDKIERGGAVPTEAELDDMRARREKAWLLLRRQWLEGEDVDAEAAALDPDHALPEAFEHRVGAADDIADRLRREADSVQEQARLLAEKSRGEADLERIRRTLGEHARERQHLHEEWQSLWRDTGVMPLTPPEMQPWREDVQKLKEQLTELNQERLQLQNLQDRRAALVDALRDELAALAVELPREPGLEAALQVAETKAGELEQAVRQREAVVEEVAGLEKRLGQVSDRVRDAEEALRDWTSRWQAAVQDLGQGADALPAEVDLTMQDLVTLFETIGQVRELNQRIEGIDRDARRLANDATRLAARACPEHVDLPVEELIGVLKGALDAAVEDATRRGQIEAQIKEQTRRASDARDAVAEQERTLAQLCKEAVCGSPDELESAENNSRARASSTAELEALDRELLDIGEGLSLDDLEAQVQELDPDTLVGDIDELRRVIEQELEPQQTELAERKGQESSELRRMDGKDDAAALAEQGQLLLEGIRSRVARYTRLKLAARVLRDEIEHYRRENQGPLIARASEYFAALTRDSFSGLVTDFDEGDQAVLLGVRPNESRVGVAGMSSGTRDQLYLALRLASIEKYLDGGEAMPFIVDDILVHFDDDRSRAALDVLAGFAEKTQIILFTHHRRLVEQSQDLASTAPVQVHELNA